LIPSIDIRIGSLISALSGAVGPALKDNNFAAEQTALLVGHLQVLRQQHDFSDEFETLEYAHARRLASELLEIAPPDQASQQTADRLRRLVETPPANSMASIRACREDINAGISDLVEANGKTRNPNDNLQFASTILRYEKAQSIRSRSFFSLLGYEDGSTEIPPLEEMMNQFRIDYGVEPKVAQSV
jgi:hypothetical protein